MAFSLTPLLPGANDDAIKIQNSRGRLFAATLLLSYDRTFPQLQTFNLTAKVDFQKPPGPFDFVSKGPI